MLAKKVKTLYFVYHKNVFLSFSECIIKINGYHKPVIDNGITD